MKKACLIFLVFVILVGLPLRAEVINCIVATVDGRPVTLVDVLVVVEFRLCEFQPAAGQREIREIAARTIIDRRLALRASVGFQTVEKKEVENSLLGLKKEMGSQRFETGLATYGLEESDLLSYLEEKISFDKLLAARFSRPPLVGRRDVEDYYHKVYAPEKRQAGIEPSSLDAVEEEIIDRLQRKARDEQVAGWLRELRERAGIRLNSDCLK